MSTHGKFHPKKTTYAYLVNKLFCELLVFVLFFKYIAQTIYDHYIDVRLFWWRKTQEIIWVEPLVHRQSNGRPSHNTSFAPNRTQWKAKQSKEISESTTTARAPCCKCMKHIFLLSGNSLQDLLAKI